MGADGDRGTEGNEGNEEGRDSGVASVWCFGHRARRYERLDDRVHTVGIYSPSVRGHVRRSQTAAVSAEWRGRPAVADEAPGCPCGWLLAFGFMNWLDTETKAILQRESEPPLAPAKVAEFALVLGSKGVDRERLIRAVCRINDCGRSAAAALAGRPSPVTINLDLTEEDATLGQFELVCCEAISAVVRSEVAGEADREYLADLLRRISSSPEFQPAAIRVDDVPTNESGQRFVDQFLGLDLKTLRERGFPLRLTMPAKKARIMKHWAARVGAQVHDGADGPGAASDAGAAGAPAGPGN